MDIRKSDVEVEPIQLHALSWSQQNSISVFEFSPFKKSESSSYDDSSDFYFREPDAHDLVKHESILEFAERISTTPTVNHWLKIGIRHHLGVCVPVFSLRSEQNGSCGVGEYLDLIPLIDWCTSNGFDIVQLLPINDTSPFDNSPFAPISSFALNWRLLSLRQLPNFDDQTESMKMLIEELEQLNQSDRVQWTEVNDLKRKWLFSYFLQVTQRGDTLNSEEYTQFLSKNRSWLEGYGLFCLLKNKHEWSHWSEWEETLQIPKEYKPDKDPSASVLNLPFAKQLLDSDRQEIQFYMFLQFLCNQQMSKVKQYAESKRVFIKGDIPFLVSSDSADVWLNQALFDTENTAGSPPDDLNPEGQNWGVPLYNWTSMKRSNYGWWKKRLESAAQYFHLYRVDHIVGFFRVWSIPKGKPASEGKFVPSDPEEYVAQGEEILNELLGVTGMLPIGEDLGAVPPQVRKSMQGLGICGTKVLRWERKWDQPGQPYIPFEDYNCDSMTTVSTHDSEILAQWWQNLSEEELELYIDTTVCPTTGPLSPSRRNETAERAPIATHQRSHILMLSHSTPSMFHINLIQEYLALDPSLVHEEIDKERINVPGQVSDNNWSYRMLPTIETIAASRDLSESIGRLIGGRTRRRSFTLKNSSQL